MEIPDEKWEIKSAPLTQDEVVARKTSEDNTYKD